MTRTIEGVEEWARTNPKYTYKDGSGRQGSWAGLCEAFVNNAGDFSQSFDSAMTAGNNSGLLNGNWRQAPRGAIHYWAGVGGDGHVAFELGGGLLLMASSSVDDAWGTAMGTIWFERYARLGIPYRGWTRAHGSETLAGSPQSGDSQEEDDMYTADDRSRDNAMASQVNSIWRFIYEIDINDFAQRQVGAGKVLLMLKDAIFKKTIVPSSTTGDVELPGGLLRSVAELLKREGSQ